MRGPTDLAAELDPHSMQTLSGRLVERATASDPHGQVLQFERQGYFTHDDESRPERLVFNRTASLCESPGKPPTVHLESGNEMVLSESTRLSEEAKAPGCIYADRNQLEATIKTSIARIP